MRIEERIEIVTHILDKCYPNPQASLDYTTPFTLLVATLLSAQCHDEQVNRVTPKLFEKANTPQKMALLSEETIGKLIYSCGFYHSKAHYIRELSEQLCTLHNGNVPQDFESLEKLSGVGHKTASVVLGHAFGLPAFPVDTHIRRLAIKWKLSPGPSVERVEQDLKRIFPQNTWFKRHIQIISYGRQYCNRQACRPEHPCEICSALKIYSK
ncbi:MAG: endonuclease III [bacterium]